MTENIQEIHLVVRENQREAQKKARQNIMRAAITGKSMDMADVAMARGLVLRERENSIFSDAWVPLAVLFLIIGLVAGRQPTMLALGLVLLLIVGISTTWKNLSLWGVTYSRRFNRTRVFPGEPIELTITVGNDKALPLTWLQFRDELPIAIENEHAISQMTSEITGRYMLQNTFSLYGREQTERSFTLRFPKRGYYKLGPVTYESGDIFTLFTIQRDHQYIDQLIIFPQIYPLEALGLPAKEPFGDVKVLRSLFTDPIKTQGVRDYQPGDRFRDVHWKATAVRGNLQTKVYDPSTGMTIAVFLNVATFPKHWMGFDPELLERGVSVAGSVANYGVQQGWGVGVYANGSVPNSDQPIRVQPSRSPEQLAHVLEALAAVTEFATGSIEGMMLRTSPVLPWASTIVLVTAVVTEEIMVALIRLKEAGRRVVLISLADEPPPKGLGNILAYHIPANVPAFQKEHKAATVTEAALNSIPTPEPVGLEFELEDTN
ncbi:MAG: DUF58 domain-containing protein [Ardenticatenaceae bacterium]|nr:DUF58 domain-containing protein [Ardenticatenaceae bacterium]